MKKHSPYLMNFITEHIRGIHVLLQRKSHVAKFSYFSLIQLDLCYKHVESDVPYFYDDQSAITVSVNKR